MTLKICIVCLLFTLVGMHTMPHGSLVPFTIDAENYLSQNVEETERRVHEEDFMYMVFNNLMDRSRILWTQYAFFYHSPHLSPLKRPPRNIL